LLAGPDEETCHPWEEGDFGEDPADITQLDHMDAAALLAELWDGKTHEVGIAEDDEHASVRGYVEAGIAPFSRQFPGLAPSSGEQPLDPGQLGGVLGSLPAARIGLAPATRPADVLPLMGWLASDHFDDALPVAAVLRSWEDRFGARLLRVGADEIRLLVERPPRSIEAAQRIAAEHYALCDECAGQGLRDVPSITASLVNVPIWTFWWD